MRLTITTSLAIAGALTAGFLAWQGWWLAATIVAMAVVWGMADAYVAGPLPRYWHRHRHHHCD